MLIQSTTAIGSLLVLSWLTSIRRSAAARRGTRQLARFVAQHLLEMVVAAGQSPVAQVHDADHGIVKQHLFFPQRSVQQCLRVALVVDVVSNLISEIHQDDTDLVVICGRQLLNDKNFPLVNDASDNTDTLAGQVLLSQKQIGGLPAVRVPFFPDNALLVTSLDNLSIYFQSSAKRRSVEDNASLDQIEDRQSSNDAYVIETYGKVALVENIEIKE